MQLLTQTATSNYALKELSEDDASTVIGKFFQRGAEMESGVDQPSARRASHLHQWLLAATLTARVTYSQPQWDFFRASMYPAVIVGVVSGPRRLSLQAARRMALGVLSDTEKRLWKERASEARFLVSFWDHENR
jgi:hypothetical protein